MRTYDRSVAPALAISVSTDQATYTRGEHVHFRVDITNSGNEELLVLSHYETPDESHFDNLVIRVVRRSDGMAWNVTPARSRKAVAPIFCALVAGGVLRHELDLTDWLDANDVRLPAGTFDVSSSYQVPAGMIADAWKPCGTPVAGGALTPEMRDDGSRAVWSGTLTSNTARFRVG